MGQRAVNKQIRTSHKPIRLRDADPARSLERGQVLDPLLQLVEDRPDLAGLACQADEGAGIDQLELVAPRSSNRATTYAS